MTTVVVNCFHWIGFHFVEELLEQGEKVIGVHEKQTDQTDFLSMFFARNSSFKFKKRVPKVADQVIIIGDTHSFPMSNNVMRCIGRETNIEKLKNKHKYISMPLLFGEWMPMDQSGICLDTKHISYRSKEFQNKAVYVKDFIRICLLKSKQEIQCEKAKSPKNLEELILEMTDQIRDNSTQRKNIEKMQKHYLKYAFLYYE